MILIASPKILFQTNFSIEDLIDNNIKITEKIWLKENEICLQTIDGTLTVFILTEDTAENIILMPFAEKILPFLKFTSLLTHNGAQLKGGAGGKLDSTDEFARNVLGVEGRLKTIWPEEPRLKAEEAAPDFIRQIKMLHDKYNPIIKDNKHLEIALSYFHEAQVKSVYSDEGFINIITCLEALYNEGNVNISYKLALRTAFLISLTNSSYSPEQIFDNIKSAYNERSMLIHGGDGTANMAMRDKIHNYSRWSLICMIILCSSPEFQTTSKTKRKKDLIKKLDMAMLSDSYKQSLKTIIAANWNDFVPNPLGSFEFKNDRGEVYMMNAW